MIKSPGNEPILKRILGIIGKGHLAWGVGCCGVGSKSTYHTQKLDIFGDAILVYVMSCCLMLFCLICLI